MQCLSMYRAAFENKRSQPQDLQRQGLSDQMTQTESVLGKMVHTAVLTPSHQKQLLGSRDLEASHCLNMYVTLAYFRRR